MQRTPEPDAGLLGALCCALEVLDGLGEVAEVLTAHEDRVGALTFDELRAVDAALLTVLGLTL
ncbi:hypothetical protein [Actinomadura pelletieri]|uniref:hypothetical protein n=1 Tax=Actinomadura pelletieri TaxID=111805 RepID=UPI001B87AC66|nr:hypothetical protein [Actinomadura pelletieri]